MAPEKEELTAETEELPKIILEDPDTAPKEDVAEVDKDDTEGTASAAPVEDDDEEEESDEAGLDADGKKKERRRAARHRRKEKQRQDILRLEETIAIQARELEKIRREQSQIRDASIRNEYSELERAINKAKSSIDDEIKIRARAIALGDEEAIVQSDRRLKEHEATLQEFNSYKENVDRALEAGAAKTSPQQSANENAVRAQQAAQHNAAIFAQRNPWVDTNLGDPDSKTADDIARRLMNIGLDPASQGFWTRLEDELKQIFPGKYSNRGASMSKPQQRQPVAGSGNGRPSGNGKSHVLPYPKERLDALRQAGVKEGSPQWNRILMEYKKYDADSAKKKGAA